MKYLNKENINLGKGKIILEGTEKTEAQWKALDVSVKTHTGDIGPGFLAVKSEKKRAVKTRKRKVGLEIRTESVTECLVDLTLSALDVIVNFYEERELQSQKARYLALSKYTSAQIVQDKIMMFNKRMPSSKQFKALRLQIKKLSNGKK